MKNPQDYIRRVMEERKLNPRDVAQRAKAKGFAISEGHVHNFLQGRVGNPGIDNIKALAAGLGKPQYEVFAAFGVKVGAPSKRKTKPMPTATPAQPKRKIGF